LTSSFSFPRRDRSSCPAKIKIGAAYVSLYITELESRRRQKEPARRVPSWCSRVQVRELEPSRVSAIEVPEVASTKETSPFRTASRTAFKPDVYALGDKYKGSEKTAAAAAAAAAADDDDDTGENGAMAFLASPRPKQQSSQQTRIPQAQLDLMIRKVRAVWGFSGR